MSLDALSLGCLGDKPVQMFREKHKIDVTKALGPHSDGVEALALAIWPTAGEGQGKIAAGKH